MHTRTMHTPAPAAITHFDTAAHHWDQRPMSQQLARVVPHVLARLPLALTDDVLDFGAGTGLLATAIAPHVAQVTALDTSAAMLQVLVEKGHANIATCRGDVFTTDLGRYHAIVSCMALHHVADTTALLQRFAALLHPGGHIALVDLYQEDGSFHGDNAAKGVQHLGFAPAALRAQAEQAGLQDITLTEALHVQHRKGRSYPLFLMTGRKP